MSYTEVMSLPIKTFWLMSSSVDRIMAQKDIRALTVAVLSQGGDAAKDHRERLVLEVGTVVKQDSDPGRQAMREAVRDEEGFAELKAMANQA